MRKLFLTLVVTIFFIVMAIFVMGILKKMKDYTAIESQISTLPVFSLSTLTGSSYSTSEIDKGPVLIVRFHPECEHCRYELAEIFNSVLPEEVVKVLLISNADRNSVANFLAGFDIGEKQDIIPLIDTSFVSNDIFRKDVIPSNYIYNKELKLVKALYGEYKFETIIKYLETND